jgi:hypothetical protein
MDRANSLGLWNYSQEFLEASLAISEMRKGKLSISAYYLCGHSIELALKAFLRGNGFSIEQLQRKIGHDLGKALAEAIENGIEGLIKFNKEEKALIELLNISYKRKELEYITTGFKRFPEIEIIHKIAQSLIDSIKTFCIENKDLNNVETHWI